MNRNALSPEFREAIDTILKTRTGPDREPGDGSIDEDYLQAAKEAFASGIQPRTNADTLLDLLTRD